MVYLLDANVLITAHNAHYPIDLFPVFWDWLEAQILDGHVRMPLEIFEEVKDGGTDVEADPLYAWLQQDHLKEALVLDEEVDVDLLQQVMDESYSPVNDIQLIAIGRDPFLVAYAKSSALDRCVVTNEVSAPLAAPHNRKIPDACSTAGGQCCEPLRMLRERGFSSNWRRPQ